MDEDFEYFLKEMGPAFDRREVPASSIERYRNRLPDQLLDYWREHGWCGYAEGLFWTVDPQEYEPVLDAWIGETPFMEQDAFHVIARGAFGTLCLFGERSGRSITIVAPDANLIPSRTTFGHDLDLAIRAFFSSRFAQAYDCSDSTGQPLFTRTRAKLGRLAHDEMYGFVPALPLGGPATLDHLQKVKAVEHLVFLAQISDLKALHLPGL